MTRRIALSVLALVTAVLVLAVVPLGLSFAEGERVAFRADAADRARALSGAAEEHLSDHHGIGPARTLALAAERRGECATVFAATGRPILATRCSHVAGEDPTTLVRDVLRRSTVQVVQDGDWLTTAVPVGEVSRATGVAVISRPTAPLDDRIERMWLRLATVAAGAFAAAVAVSVLLARWVGRPLRAVASSAHALGEGALDSRATGVAGPAEVRQLAASFNTMAARTEALVHGHRAVVADVSHQLRTPLAALKLRLELLAAGADATTAAELAAAQGEIARLSRLVDGLLAVARAESAIPVPVRVPVGTVVAGRVAAWQPVAAERGVTLYGRCDPHLAATLGQGDLEQVLDNLLANSLDALPRGGTVRVDGRVRDRRVVLEVIDDGPGMDAAARATAFRRFGNPRATGSGLGLAIVHRLVTANGGSAALTQSPGGGLTVRLALPSAAGRRGGRCAAGARRGAKDDPDAWD